jgi:hypothetical protein
MTKPIGLGDLRLLMRYETATIMGVKMRKIIGIALVALAGCTTVQSAQQEPPDFQADSAKPLAEISGCIGENLGRFQRTIASVPKRGGMIFSITAEGIAQAVIAVDDLGDHRHATLWIPKVAVFAPRGQFREAVSTCL